MNDRGWELQDALGGRWEPFDLNVSHGTGVGQVAQHENDLNPNHSRRKAPISSHIERPLAVPGILSAFKLRQSAVNVQIGEKNDQDADSKQDDRHGDVDSRVWESRKRGKRSQPP